MQKKEEILRLCGFSFSNLIKFQQKVPKNSKRQLSIAENYN